MGRLTAGLIALGLALGVAGRASAQQSQSYWAFESGHVRPLALSADRTRLYAVNTPDDRLETFQVSYKGLTHLWSTPTGLEPVAVCLEPAGTRAWVVNQLSDDVSVVDLTTSPPRVIRTLLVGDEPMDCVAASGRMFVSTARRGQNTNIDPAFLTPAGSGPNFRTPGRALVWVYDPADLGTSLGGTPIEVVGDGNWADGDSVFGDSPRPLAVSADGTRVYVGIHQSGNRSSVFLEQIAASPFVTPIQDAPTINSAGVPRPPVGAIVQRNPATGQWTDDAGRNFTNSMRVALPDLDVFEIDSANPSPSGVRVLRSFAGVGTVLFNIAVNPASGMIYISNTEANNKQRFEGPGTFCAAQVPPCGSLRGHLHESRITLIDPSTSGIAPRHLNKHLVPYTPATDAQDDNDKSLATPLGMAVTGDGARLYVAAYGSRKIGVFDTGELLANSFVPNAANQIELSVGGPSGLVLDEPRQRIYVSVRLGHALAVIDTSTFPGTEVALVPLPHDPEPEVMRAGRPLLYDARISSSNGEASCSSCHVFGNFDSLAWNLGNPDGAVIPNPNPFVPGNDPTIAQTLHPMKGPMLTQSLRGIVNNGPMHLRGDRTGGNAVPPGDPLSEFEAFVQFDVAYQGLLGRATTASTGEIMALANLALELRYPPNPYRDLSNAEVSHPWPGNPTGTDFSTGRNLFFGMSDPDGMGGLPADATDNFIPGGAACISCHMLSEGSGNFGTAGLSSFVGESQHFKVSHLRNIYARTGFFGIGCIGVLPLLNQGSNPCVGTPNFGEQVRGFGYLHDGGIATPLDFAGSGIFRYQGTAQEQADKRRAVAEFMLGFPTDLRPIVGQQITLDAGNAATAGPRIDLLIIRALAGDCDVVVKGQIAGEPRGWVMSAFDTFDGDHASQPPLGDTALRALASVPGQELTYSCVPPGSGPRIGINRDADAVRDADECGDANADGVAAAADPAAIRRALAGSAPGVNAPSRCNVLGAPDNADPDMDGLPNDCDLLDAVVLRRALASPSLAPGIGQVCTASLCPSGPGVCGCGVAVVDTDMDGTADCVDSCASDPLKIVPGLCGCGVADTDGDGDLTPDCNDLCPVDPLKTAPGTCGCGVADTDGDGDLTPDCNDLCPADPLKTAPGQCGCGIADTDSDEDGTPDCLE